MRLISGRPGRLRWDRRTVAVTAAATVAALALTGVVVRLATGDGRDAEHSRSAEQAAGRLKGCGPLTLSEIHGRRPAYLPAKLGRFWGDEAACRAMWLGGRKGHFVPQGLAVDGRTGWISGYRSDAPKGERACRLVKVDLRRLEVLAVQKRIAGAVPGRGTTYCRHGGAVVADGPKRLWVVETRRLWLLDPQRVGRSGAVKRVWRLGGKVRGSVGVLVPGPGPYTGLGLGYHAREGRARIDWFDPRRIRRSSSGVLRSGVVQRAPRALQGLAYGHLREKARPGLWATITSRSCGILVGPRGQFLPVLPGAEGIAFDGRGGLWMLSEHSVRLYYDKGDRVIPQLVRYSVENLAAQIGLPGGERRVRRCLA